MADDPESTQATDRVRQFLAGDRWAKGAGVRVSHIAPGRVMAHLVVRHDMVNGHGGAHGAVLFGLADVAFALACNSHGYEAVGRSCQIEYLAPASVGDTMTAVAVERNLVGRNGIYDVTVTRDTDGVVLAEMRGHSRRIDPAV
jgi:acyl-CoA thioesterase